MRRNRDKMLLESLVRKYGKNGVKSAIKNINESLSRSDYVEAQQIIRVLVDNQEQLNKLINKYGDPTPEFERILNVYDEYVLDVFYDILESDDYEWSAERAKRMAEDNEWENGTEASMLINFLTDVADEVGISINENNKVDKNAKNINESTDDFETRDLIYREFYNAMERACLSLQRKGIEITEDVVRTGVEWFDLHNDFYEV